MTRHVIPFAVMAASLFINTSSYADTLVQPMNPVSVVAQNAPPAPVQTREAFVGGIMTQVLGIIHMHGNSLATKKSQLEHTFLQVVDLGWIAQFVLGKPWDNATPQQRSQYVSLYGKYLSSMYLAGLDEKSEQNLRDIKIIGMDDAFDDAFTVHTQMVMTEGNNVSVDYMIREQDGQRKVIDIVLEGVSMLRTHRSELGAVASAKGVDGVIAALQAKMGATETHLASARH